MISAARPVSALTIAGSDSGGGAGIQADLKTFAAHRVHGLSAIAALTAQHTRGVTAVHAPPVEFLRAQIDACFDDFDVRAVKLGMLATTDIIRTVSASLRTYRPSAIVIDPVMIATSGAKLLADDALDALRSELLPLADVLTPNLPEAEWLVGNAISDIDAMREACKKLLALGARSVLLKGGHLNHGDVVVDLLAQSTPDHAMSITEIEHPRLSLEAHGTGCTLAAAVAARLAAGASVQDACTGASDYVHRALTHGYRPGRSALLVLDHFGAAE